MAVHREAGRARWDGAHAVTRERSVVISANSQRHGLTSWSLEAAVAARLEQGLQPARGRDRDGRLVNREVVLIGSAVEARRQAWHVEESSRGSQAVAVATAAPQRQPALGRQSGASGLQRSSAPMPTPNPPTQPPDPGRVAHSSADHPAPAPCQLSAPGVGPS